MLSGVHAQRHRLAVRLVTAQHLSGSGPSSAMSMRASRTTQSLQPLHVVCLSQPQHVQQQLRFATKKAGGSSNNGRDSAGRRLGIKLFPGLRAKPGAIIVRQRGRKFYAGENVGMGNDHTIFSKVDGIVKFTRHATKKKRNMVHVLEAGA